MAHYLPPAILNFFQPRPEFPAWPNESKRAPIPLTGVSAFLHRFKDEVPLPVKNLTPKEVKEKRAQKRDERHAIRLAKHIAKWNPKENPNATPDAYKTVFVGRLNYDVTDEDLKSEFEFYGPVVSAKIVRDEKTGKSRGYGFVQFERTADFKEAYKDADGRKIHDRRIVVDVERGRTVKGWHPRRLGGGKGGTRLGGKDVNQRFSGREPPVGSSARGSSRERESARDRDHDRDRDREREREREREERRRRERERGGERSDRGDRDRETGREREKERETRRRSRSRSRGADRADREGEDRERRGRRSSRSRSPRRR